MSKLFDLKAGYNTTQSTNSTLPYHTEEEALNHVISTAIAARIAARALNGNTNAGGEAFNRSVTAAAQARAAVRNLELVRYGE